MKKLHIPTIEATVSGETQVRETAYMEEPWHLEDPAGTTD